MALETLENVAEIGGFIISHGRKGDPASLNPFIKIDHERNEISFKIQDGPVKEVGVNGCQVDQLVQAAKLIIDGLNQKFPCRENSLAVTKLDEADHWLAHRKKNREVRGVEGYDKA